MRAAPVIPGIRRLGRRRRLPLSPQTPMFRRHIVTTHGPVVEALSVQLADAELRPPNDGPNPRPAAVGTPIPVLGRIGDSERLRAEGTLACHSVRVWTRNILVGSRVYNHWHALAGRE
jgi:hypothetical protein